jgi:hypothetical protein
LVYEFQFEGFEQAILEDQELKECLQLYEAYDKKRPTEQGLNLQLLAAQCPIQLKQAQNLSANYTNFFKTPTFNWE